MTMQAFWEEQYIKNQHRPLPWCINRPDHNLVHWLKSQSLKPNRVLDLGCGHGDNAIWLAKQGFSVTASDASSTVINQARELAKQAGVQIDFFVNDAMEDLPLGPFDLVFDRGMFHCFNIHEDRQKVVKNISEVLTADGSWLSTIGSTECCQDTQVTPPRRSMIEIASAVEPYLRINSIVASTEEMFTEVGLQHCSAWFMVAQKRQVPVRPWTPGISGWQHFL